MPKQSGYWWVKERDTYGSPDIVWFNVCCGTVLFVGDHIGKCAERFSFIRECLYEHDTNRKHCIADCLGE